jgi:taurine dioxygenase
MIGEAVLPLTVDPLTPCFGARVHHDLSRPATADQADALRCALDRHRVLVFPGQHLNHADLLAAGRLFGTIDTSTDRRYTVAGFPGLTVISNITEDGRRIGVYDGDQEEEWHADNSYKRELTSTTLLYSVITPDEGGDTRFADATTAYADLPDLLKSRVDTLEATHSIQQLGAMQAHASAGHSSAATGTLAGLDEVRHPLAPRHPVTGNQRHPRAHRGRHQPAAHRPAHPHDQRPLPLPPPMDARRSGGLGQPGRPAHGVTLRQLPPPPAALPGRSVLVIRQVLKSPGRTTARTSRRRPPAPRVPA